MLQSQPPSLAKPAPLDSQVEAMKHGEHYCLVYETPEEQWAAVVPFLTAGLARNEACAYITDEHSIDEVRHALQAHGVEVERHVARGALVFLSKREAYLREGSFNPPGMISFLGDTVREAAERGFSGFRVTGEMTWALGRECGCEDLVEYEALLNDFFPGQPALAICQYNRRRFGADLIRDVLRTHPIAILGDQVCANLFYETPAMVLGRESAERRVDWMVHQLKHFRASEERLERAVQARDEFLGVASHELNTPLTSLKLQVQGLQRLLAQRMDQARSPEEEKLARTLGRTDRQVRRLSQLVSDLLDVSRINAHQLALRRAPVDLGELLEETVDHASDEPSLDAGRIQLQRGRGAPIIGVWDRSRLEQAVTNLLSNALKYGRGRPVQVRARVHAGHALLEVQDHGLGVRAEDLTRIFERFERAISPSEVSGLGLGLYITREIARAHGGSVEVQSRPGEGSTFTLRLPLACA
ncbi:histidine kinase [Aggregicoccus sp. 17bor-14]|uniref:MEDS domain-containing protein n=1 Tax=Myxococcaceae TaxID=31 RepID=UPI00129C8A78|nr:MULTISPECIES: MEDS domain-containing protein [Myxococcaceae]MBF5046481.1 MEDS domain-containing protein [Simulacricoccus sp. 17bor-14]MRI92198.1 histidine kinase [Aggregicoccus sp. 17bor-14]